MKVLINTKNGRKEIDAELIEERARTLLVRLPDGNVIIRKKNRDIPKQK